MGAPFDHALDEDVLFRKVEIQVDPPFLQDIVQVEEFRFDVGTEQIASDFIVEILLFIFAQKLLQQVSLRNIV